MTDFILHQLRRDDEPPLAAADVDEATFNPSHRLVAYRREAIDAVGGYPEWLAIGEDMWVDLRWRDLGSDMGSCPTRSRMAPAGGPARPGVSTRYARGMRRPECT